MEPKGLVNRRILITSLNWGMGHLARSIGLMQDLIEQQNTLFFAGNTEQVQIVKQYIESIKTFELSNYPFHFSAEISLNKSLLNSSIQLLKHIRKEKREIAAIVAKHEIEIIISDHRYGCYAKNVTSIFLTHQLRMPLSGIWKFGNVIHKGLMLNFDVIWVPDYSDSRLSGELSMMKRKVDKILFIGPLSRFKRVISGDKSIDKVLVLSGPDEFAIRFARQFLTDNDPYFSGIIIGKKEVLNRLLFSESIRVIESSNWTLCDSYIASTKLLISATGYSTLMDLEYLACSFFLTPTPGQVEQEYLADFHSHRMIKQ